MTISSPKENGDAFFDPLEWHGIALGRCCAPEVNSAVPNDLLQSLQSVTSSVSCRTTGCLERLAGVGFERVILLRPVVVTDHLQNLVSVCQTFPNLQVQVVFDHYRHAELLSEALARRGVVGTAVELLVDVDLGQQTTGVRPGPDSVRLVRGVISMPGVSVVGIFLNDEWCTGARQKRVSFSDCLTIGTHCQRMIEANGHRCPEVVTGGTCPALAAAEHFVTTIVPRSLLATVRAEDVLPDPQQVVTARVISRPSLERCVARIGRSELAAIPQPFQIQPSGASVLHSTDDVTTFLLSGESLDLRIGDVLKISADERPFGF